MNKFYVSKFIATSSLKFDLVLVMNYGGKMRATQYLKLCIIGAMVANAIGDVIKNGQNSATVVYTIAKGWWVPSFNINYTM